MKSILCCVAAAALFAAPAAQAQITPKTIFQPNGPWIADYGADYCRISRTFESGRNQLSIALERLQPGAPVRLIVVGDGLRPHRGAERIGYAFGPKGASGEARYVRSVMADGRPFLSFAPVVMTTTASPSYDRRAEQEAAHDITAVTFEEGLTAPVQVETGMLRAPIEALQSCTDDLLTVWGLDAARHAAPSALAVMKTSADGVLPAGSVPFREMRKLGGGANQLRLLVGADGSVADCAVHSPTLAPALNDRICRLATERASFAPARDADGRPMASLWIGSPLELLPQSPRARNGGGLVASSALGATWGLTAPPSDAPAVVLVVPAPM